MKRIKINHHMKTRKETIKFEKFIKIIDTFSILGVSKQFAFE